MNFESISILHVESIGRIAWLHSGSIEQEPNCGRRLPLAFAKRVHQLLQLRGSLDLKKDLVVVVRNLDVKVFTCTLRWSLVLLWWRRRVRHAVLSSRGLRSGDGEEEMRRLQSFLNGLAGRINGGEQDAPVCENGM